MTHPTKSAGTVFERYRYDVFGAPTIYDGDWHGLTASAVSNRFMFTGREYNVTFGFYEYRARAYHPGLGRFISEDPKSVDAGDYNLFWYVHNDPSNRTDPMGLIDIKHLELAKVMAQTQRVQAAQKLIRSLRVLIRKHWKKG